MSHVTAAYPLCEDHVAKSNSRRSLDALRWASALVALGSAGLHVLALATGAALAPGRVLAIALMGMACLPCALHLVLLPRRRTWVQTAAVSTAMLVAHPQVPAGAAHHGGDHTGAAVGVAMVVVPAVGLVLALGGLALDRERWVPAG